VLHLFQNLLLIGAIGNIADEANGSVDGTMTTTVSGSCRLPYELVLDIIAYLS
jgi:hypothetical protein